MTFDLIFASTLVRASESAQIVGETLDIPIEYEPDWMECDNGPLAGLPFDVGRERYPRTDFSNPFQPYIAATGEGEGSWDMVSRAAGVLQRVVRRGPGGGSRRHPQRRNVLHTRHPTPTPRPPQQRRAFRLRRRLLRAHLVRPHPAHLGDQGDDRAGGVIAKYPAADRQNARRGRDSR